MKHSTEQYARFFFNIITEYPKIVLLGGALLILFGLWNLPELEKDTTTEAFIPEDDSVLVYRNKVKDTFGLNDPMVIAVVHNGPDGIFTPHTLSLVQWLTEQVKDIDGIDYERVTSISTENDIIGTENGMMVDPFYESPPKTQAEADSVRKAVFDFPLYMGSLVDRKGMATLIVAELLDPKKGTRIYHELVKLTKEAPTQNEKLHVAGEGAISGYLADYIDRDARRLNPMAALIITLVLVIAYATLRGALIPNLIVLATVSTALGGMAFAGIDFFVITNALTIILIAIAVADGIHILGEYYELAGQHPGWSQRRLVIKTMMQMWRPVTITSVTTSAGFAGIWLSSYMPPMKYFGLFAAIGVMAAWIFALTVVPAVLVLLKPQQSRMFKAEAPQKSDYFTRFMKRFGVAVMNRPVQVLSLTASIALLGIYGASNLEINEDRIESFQPDEPIVQAHNIINDKTDGTTYLDVVVETPEKEGLFNPRKLKKIEALQQYAATLPYVKGSTSAIDLLKQMNKAMHADREHYYRLPDDSQLIAQYFLLYSAGGNPTDFEEYIDYDYRLANIRLRMDSGLYTDQKQLMNTMRTYINTEFNEPGLKATVSGRTALNTHWIGQIGENHFKGVGIALLLVTIVGMLSFRSFWAGIYAAATVALAVLLVYAVMGTFGIWLGVGTSMFAAIAIGVGVDFAVHTIDRLRVYIRQEKMPLKQALLKLYPTTGRALLFNLLAVAFGFGVLATSSVPPLQRFGSLVAVAVLSAFLGGMTLLPALIYVIKPTFLFKGRERKKGPKVTAKGKAAALLLLITVPSFLTAQDLPEGIAIVEKVNARDNGRSVKRNLEMTLIDRRGKIRKRETVGYRKYYGREKRSVLFYENPTNIRGTAFLTYDYPDPDRDDDQWLYLPALRKTRRISAGDRGDYFLGTDFTYEDIKLENRMGKADYHWETLGTDTVDGHKVYLLQGIPVDEETAEELGYGKVLSYIDPEIWISRKGEYWDERMNRLKTIRVKEIRKVNGIWTAHRLEAENHKTGHRTLFEFSNVNYEEQVSDRLFTEQALRRGIR